LYHPLIAAAAVQRKAHAEIDTGKTPWVSSIALDLFAYAFCRLPLARSALAAHLVTFLRVPTAESAFACVVALVEDTPKLTFLL
jgi:hypothetical protein